MYMYNIIITFQNVCSLKIPTIHTVYYYIMVKCAPAGPSHCLHTPSPTAQTTSSWWRAIENKMLHVYFMKKGISCYHSCTGLWLAILLYSFTGCRLVTWTSTLHVLTTIVSLKELYLTTRKDGLTCRQQPILCCFQ